VEEEVTQPDAPLQASDVTTVASEAQALVQAETHETAYSPPSSQVAYFHNPKPNYPPAARRRGMEGLVELIVQVDSSGRPIKIDIKHSSGFDVLDREALKSVWRWRFEPARRAGMAVAGEVIVPVRYRLDQG